MATYHLAVEELDDAIRVGEAGLALSDGTGYTIWALHRLLAVLAEAYLRKRELAAARKIGERLRREAEPIGHVLGVAWADSCDAILAWLQGEANRGALLLRGAAEALEQIPFVPDAARIRRQLAGRLADLGDREGALRELRHVHDVFMKLGAQDELRRARVQFHELEARPPSRPSGPGAEGLTGREVDIIRLVATRRSNKAIAQALGISPRTVTTHLSNIYQKLAISSRGELADLAPRILPTDR
jgi:DNA-binding CsgD family transcriptional regulator